LTSTEDLTSILPGDGDRRADHISGWPAAVTVSVGLPQAPAAAGLAGDAHGSTIILSRGVSSSDEFGMCDDATEVADDAAVFFVFDCEMQKQQSLGVKCFIVLMIAFYRATPC